MCIRDRTGISFSDDTPEADLEKARHRATEIATNIDLNQALRYDSIFADVGLGLYCVIVTK